MYLGMWYARYMNKSRTHIAELVAGIEPWDERERQVIMEVGGWLASNAGVYRLVRPDVPPKHLVVYFVLVDMARRSLLLGQHKLAGLWLPTGGHMEPEEGDPRQTARRELAEELGPRAGLVSSVATLPLFATATRTRGAGSHTDVTLWYVVPGDEHMWLEPDPREFNGHRWFMLDEILAMDPDELDPEMHRFVEKLQKEWDDMPASLRLTSL